jgi:hypothetical protein
LFLRGSLLIRKGEAGALPILPFLFLTVRAASPAMCGKRETEALALM